MGKISILPGHSKTVFVAGLHVQIGPILVHVCVSNKQNNAALSTNLHACPKTNNPPKP